MKKSTNPLKSFQIKATIIGIAIAYLSIAIQNKRINTMLSEKIPPEIAYLGKIKHKDLNLHQNKKFAILTESEMIKHKKLSLWEWGTLPEVVTLKVMDNKCKRYFYVFTKENT